MRSVITPASLLYLPWAAECAGPPIKIVPLSQTWSSGHNVLNDTELCHCCSDAQGKRCPLGRLERAGFRTLREWILGPLGEWTNGWPLAISSPPAPSTLAQLALWRGHAGTIPPITVQHATLSCIRGRRGNTSRRRQHRQRLEDSQVASRRWRSRKRQRLWPTSCPK